jgi:CRP/FNR family cyclic AMP-dependent transcriptional regulator
MEKLHALSLFVNLLPAELVIVDDLLHERHYLKDEVIFDEGEDGKALYIVVDGEVLVCRQGEQENGRIATLGTGTFFGELALLDDMPRSAQVCAATDCDLIVFFRDDFASLLDTHSRIASKIARQLARHIGARMRELALNAGAHQHL